MHFLGKKASSTTGPSTMYTITMQSQNTVTAHSSSEQLLLLGVQ